MSKISHEPAPRRASARLREGRAPQLAVLAAQPRMAMSVPAVPLASVFDFASTPIVTQSSVRAQHPIVQTKLTVGSPDDPCEREADAAADRVMRSLAAGPIEGETSPGTIQAKCSACEDVESELDTGR